jgi:putative oxidoreductase
VLNVVAVFLARCLLVALFLPFSALDKILNFGAATDQAGQAVSNPLFSRLLVLAGLCVEIICSVAILTGITDRLAAFILGLYCLITALLWKQFWAVPGFHLRGPNGHRELFWDFLKNVALGGGFLLLAFGWQASGAAQFFAHPLLSSHPYSQGAM